MNLKLKDSDDLHLKFDHIRGGDAELRLSCNPLTGDWLQTHRHGGAETSYFGTKTDGLTLAKNIIAKSAKHHLRCNVTVSRRTVIPD